MADGHPLWKNSTSTLSSHARTARVDSVQSNPVGAMIYLSAADLQHLGIDPTTTSRVTYQITTIGDQRLLTLSAANSSHTQSPVNNHPRE